MGELDRILRRPKCGIREPKMPVDMSRIGPAVDVNVDAARQGTSGIAGLQDLCTADLQVLARRSGLALVEQIERQGIVRVGLHHEIVALLGQLDELGAQLARAQDVTAYVMHITQAAQRPGEVTTVSVPSRQMLRSGVHRLDLWSGKAPRRGQWGTQCNLHLKLAAQLLIGGWAVPEHLEGRGQMTIASLFADRPTASCPARNQSRSLDRQARLRSDGAQQLGLTRDKIGEPRLEDGGNPAVQLAPSTLKQEA